MESSAPVLEAPSQKKTESFLDERPKSFALPLINQLAEANGFPAFKTHERSFTDGVKMVEEQGVKQVSLPEQPTLKELIDAARLIEPGLHEERTPLSVFAKRLRDSAVIMTNDRMFLDHHLQQVAESLYGVGETLSAAALGMPIPETPASFEEIRSKAIVLPPGVSKEKYTNDLFLFLLGKGSVLNYPYEDKALQNTTESTFYSALYARWRKRKNITLDMQEDRDKFDKYLLNRKDTLKNLLASTIVPNLQDGRGIRAIEELIEQVSSQQLDDALFSKGREFLEKQMKSPPFLLDDVSPELRHKLDTLFPGEQIYEKRVFETVEKLMVDFTQRELRGESIKTIDKIRDIWDVCQTYLYNIQNKTPEVAVKSREMQCSMTSYLLGQLYEKYIPKEVVVLTDLIPGHMRLIVAEKSTIQTSDPKLYFVDVVDKRYWRDQEVPEEGSGGQTGILPIEDKKFSSQIVQEILQNPDDINLVLALDPNSSFIDRIGSHHNVGNFKSLSQSIVWNHLVSSFQGDEKQLIPSVYQKAIESNRNLFHNLISD